MSPANDSTMSRGVWTPQQAVADGERLELAEVDGLIELSSDPLREGTPTECDAQAEVVSLI